MNAYRVHLPMRDAQGETVTLDTPTLGLALVAAEINLAGERSQGGEAQLWHGDRLLARVCLQPGARRGLWQINAA